MTLLMSQVPALLSSKNRIPGVFDPQLDLAPPLEPMSQLDRVLRNYNARTFSPTGGAMPLWATRTGDIPLPNPIRYDAMGYAYARPQQPAYATLGQAADETPEVRTLPWNIDRAPSAAELKRQRSDARWDRASTLVGVLGGALGIALSYRALKSG